MMCRTCLETIDPDTPHRCPADKPTAAPHRPVGQVPDGMYVGETRGSRQEWNRRHGRKK